MRGFYFLRNTKGIPKFSEISPGSALRHRITDSRKDPQRVAAAVFHSEHRTERMHYFVSVDGSSEHE